MEERTESCCLEVSDHIDMGEECNEEPLIKTTIFKHVPFGGGWL